MKKVITAALIASLLILPLQVTVLADHEEAPAQPAAVQDFLPGDMPAGLAPDDSMLPAIHGLVLAMLNHGAPSFDLTDTGLVWESLYNMLSLYGQLDSRSEEQGGVLLLLEETVQDYAAALDISLADLPPLPSSLQDRLTCDPAHGFYYAVCGSDDLAQIQVQTVRTHSGEFHLSGKLIYDAEGETLTRFEAVLQPRDNMFGYAVTGLTLG